MVNSKHAIPVRTVPAASAAAAAGTRRPSGRRPSPVPQTAAAVPPCSSVAA